MIIWQYAVLRYRSWWGQAKDSQGKPKFDFDGSPKNEEKIEISIESADGKTQLLEGTNPMATLNQLGLIGWELVQMSIVNVSPAFRGGVIAGDKDFYLKRPNV